MNKLALIKLLHTAIWLFFNGVMIYLAYAVITGRIGKWVWLGLASFAIEGLVLLGFRMTCPLTILAKKYADSTKDNFDIYLPNWLAKYTKIIYTSMLAVIVILLFYRLLAK